MWKKGDPPEQDLTPQRPRPSSERPAAASGERPAAAPRTGGQATIGRSITIRGEVTGDEDLVIEGHVDGSVALDQHAVTVGSEGQVKAHITARIVTVEGRVEGNLTGQEQVTLRRAAWVEGDIQAPRVVLEDGAHFKGGVDMSQVRKADRTATLPGKPAEKPVAEKVESAKPLAGSGQPALQGSGATMKAGGVKG